MPEYIGGLEIFSVEESEELRKKWSLEHPFRSWFREHSRPVLRHLGNAWNFFRYDLGNGLRNLWRWFPEIWGLRDWDGGYLFSVMERQMRHMAECIGRYGHHLGSAKNAKQLRIAAECCRRLANDWEPGQPGDENNYKYNTEDWLRWMRIRGQAIQKRRRGEDVELPVNPALRILCKELERHSQSWWD